ncbi:MAG: hypothetical protein AB4038_00620 [Prochloraceae cyanobacterium]
MFNQYLCLFNNPRQHPMFELSSSQGENQAKLQLNDRTPVRENHATYYHQMSPDNTAQVFS